MQKLKINQKEKARQRSEDMAGKQSVCSVLFALRGSDFRFRGKAFPQQTAKKLFRVGRQRCSNEHKRSRPRRLLAVLAWLLMDASDQTFLGVQNLDVERALEVPLVAFDHTPFLRQPHRDIVAEMEANGYGVNHAATTREECVVEEDDAKLFQCRTLFGSRLGNPDAAEQSEVPFDREVARLNQDGTRGKLELVEPVIVGVPVERDDPSVSRGGDLHEFLRIVVVLQALAVDENGVFLANRRIVRREGLNGREVSAGANRVVLEAAARHAVLCEVEDVPLRPHGNAAKQKLERWQQSAAVVGFGSVDFRRTDVRQHPDRNLVWFEKERLSIHFVLLFGLERELQSKHNAQISFEVSVLNNKSQWAASSRSLKKIL
ncbi:MAG: hypothetical protein UV94_C0010G0042 [Parcubacteria group bacterium GW2011_GWC1_43_30]|nr:MAG: hypothetical protein UV94_C0010G0042 [Parcubacteria group bacterium GW2011_GWC1_43_30]